MGRPLSCLIFVLAASAPCWMTAQLSTGTITGVVVEKNGSPVGNATIRLESAGSPTITRSFTTDDAGAFRCPLLLPGTWSATIKRAGYATTTQSVVVRTGEIQHVRWVLTQETVTVVEVVAAASDADMRSPRGTRFNTEQYHRIQETGFKAARSEPLSTFSIDVDTASYSNLRRFLNDGQLPPADAVRLEELVNYFPYDLPEPTADKPFAVSTEVFACPWQPTHQILRVSLQGRKLETTAIPPRNLVFLVDVSGSMNSDNKLPLVKEGLRWLTQQLRPEDHVALVVYAGNSGLVLPPTSGRAKATILEALDRLQAGGSTQGAAGIEQAYAVAKEHFKTGADNRVILCTDGDFNVGITDEGSLIRLIETQRKTGVFLTCLGFGMDNLKDGMLEQLADKGNGNYGYIDSLREMKKVFGEGGAGLVTMAKDVKLQVEFNPAKVQGYRLLGYENRRLEHEDFNNDTKDAGDMNAGHTVTALFELIPPGVPLPTPAADPLKYQTEHRLLRPAPAELATVKIRFKKPDGFFSRRIDVPVPDRSVTLEKASETSRWACAVAAAAMVLRDSPHRGQANLELAQQLAASAVGRDAEGYRREFQSLLQRAQTLRSPGNGGEPSAQE